MKRTRGLHHITAIASDPARNHAFYVGFLGLRLVKKTVNFDDPSTYHLYYGDESGNPGTIVTFFPWPDARPGRIGAGQATRISFAIPVGAAGFWRDRAAGFGVEVRPLQQLDDQGLCFDDPDGMQIALVESGPGVAGRGDLSAEVAITGMHSTTLEVTELLPTLQTLTAQLGYTSVADDGRRYRFSATDEIGTYIDVLHVPSGPWGEMGAGTVHHVAFRADNDEDQLTLRTQLIASGFRVSDVRDRNYFHSIYFREPGGILFEVATDPPGFAVDEPHESLGAKLMLPEWFEPRRASIEAVLPALGTAE